MIQRNVSWGLVRISQRNALESETWNNHLYAADGGEGVDIYIIDTGTKIEHVDFEGRATRLKRILENEPEEDVRGHGTLFWYSCWQETWGCQKGKSLFP